MCIADPIDTPDLLEEASFFGVPHRTDALERARHELVVPFHHGWLFNHPDAVRDILVTHDRVLTKSPALRWARFTLGNGLLTNEGPTYRRQRALIQPSLHPKALGGYASIMTAQTGRMMGTWSDGRLIDVHREMMRLTLLIVAESLFGRSIGPEVERISHAMDMNVEAFRRLTRPWGRLLAILPTPFTFRYLFARHRLITTLRRIIAERRASKVERDDLLGRLLRAREGVGDTGMTERQLRDECVTLFAAGHETTANAMTFTIRLLARHRHVMRRVREESMRVLGSERLPTIDDMDTLTYTRQVIAESMRLYPPAWIQGRQALETIEIAGHAIRRKEVVFISQWLTHRDPRWWPEPSRFDPDRFGPEQSATRPRWAYFPFGGGLRVCVGEAFAWAEMILALSVIARRWDFEPADDAPLQLEPGITLRPHGAVRVIPRAAR